MQQKIHTSPYKGDRQQRREGISALNKQRTRRKNEKTCTRVGPASNKSPKAASGYDKGKRYYAAKKKEPELECVCLDWTAPVAPCHPNLRMSKGNDKRDCPKRHNADQTPAMRPSTRR